MPPLPLCFDVVERVEALDMSEEETEEMLEEAPWHVRRWVQDLLGPSSEAVNSEIESRPSTSGLQSISGLTLSGRAPRRGVENGSEFDDLYNVEALPGASRKEIPDAEELKEPMQDLINAIDTGMDDAADRLLGTSPTFTWQSDFESVRGVCEVFSGPTPGPLKDYDSP